VRAGAVIWITGLPSSGKSTLARRVRARLLKAGRPCALLDGDDVRAALVPAPGYGARARGRLYETLGRLAALLARQGLVVLVPASSNRRAYRDRARALAPRFLEVFVDVPLDECMRRDAKGLYAKARAGKASTLPGAGATYERPLAPELTARGGRDGRMIAEIVKWASGLGARASG
jgi:adenylylsulfate kinase